MKALLCALMLVTAHCGPQPLPPPDVPDAGAPFDDPLDTVEELDAVCRAACASGNPKVGILRCECPDAGPAS